MKDLKVSVCMITYGHEAYIESAINGVLMQQCNFDLELIIANDCSPDDTDQVVNRIIENHPKGSLIKYIKHDKNIGAMANFVFTLNQVGGNYVALCEGDDYWTDPNKLQKQFDFLESHLDFSLCYHQVKWIYTYDEPKGKNEHLKISNADDKNISTIEWLIKVGWYIKTSSMFFRRIDLPAGFSELYIGDYPLHVLLAHKGKIGFLKECMSVYLVHENGMSSKVLNNNTFEIANRNFIEKIKMYKFLNRSTNQQYRFLFEVKIFDIIYNHLVFLLSKNRSMFLRQLRNYFSEYGIIFQVKYFTIKSVRKLIRSFNF